MDNPADETDPEELHSDADANADDEDGAVALE
jgi:hypothetical protein